ncbi:MAG: hypothetical protein AABY61_02900 [Nitrospirota bacterium]
MMDMGYLGELVQSGTIKADTKVGGTSDRLASVAGADNVCFPIGLRFVKPALQATAFRDRGPGVLGSGNRGDQAALWERNVARTSGFTFFHREAAGQFRCGS